MQCPACNTVNLPTHRFCGECGAELPISRTKPLPHQGERRQVTVLLADIAGFTALSENLDPEQVTSFVNQCFRVMVPVVEEFGGQVDTYLGDALLALFGTTVAHEDDPARAVRCGLAMCEQFNRFISAQQPLAGARVGLHIGINTGLAVTGQAQVSGTGRQFSVMGDTVNLAAEVEQIAGASEVAVSEATYRFTAPLFRWEQRGSTSGKGRNQQMRVYRVIEAIGEGNQVRGLDGLHAPLIGRDIEFAAIREKIGRIAQQGAVAAVFGDPGLGKSRLLAELRALVSSDTHIIWTEGRCLSYGQPPDYYPWRDVICRLCGLHGQDTAILQSELQAMLTDLVDQPDEVYAGLARLLGIGGRGNEAESRRLVAHSVQRLLNALTPRQPIIIALDDLHWADQASLALLDTLMAMPSLPGLLIIGCSRPDGSIGEQTLRKAVTDAHGLILALQPLNQSDSSELVSALLRVEGMPARLRQLILTRAEGVPFYVEEVIRSMIDSGAIYRDGEVWRAQDDAHSMEVPPTLVGVISARVDALDPAARHALQVAAVLGRRFHVAALAAMLDETLDSANLQAMLTALQYREMVRPVGGGEYSFKHVLTQEVAYSTLLLTKRREYHHTAGDYYTVQPLPPQPRAIADVRPLFDAHYHYVQAQDYTSAYALTNRIIVQRNGDMALTLDDALDRWGENAARLPLYLSLASHLWGSDAAGAWGRLGHANEQLGELSVALDCYQQAIKLAEEHSDLAAQSTWVGQIGITNLMMGNTQAALDYCNRAWMLATQLADPRLQARWLNAMGNAHRLLGEAKAAIADYNAALDINRQIGSRRGEAVQLGNLGLAYSALGLIDRAAIYYSQGLAVAKEIGDRRTEGLLLGSLALAYADLDDDEQAIEYYNQAITFAEQMKDRHSVATWLVNLSGTYAKQGEFEAAIEWLGQALAFAEETGSQGLQAEALAGLGYAHQMVGRITAAFDCYTLALDLAKAVEQPELLSIARNGLARACAAQGDSSRAASLLTLELAEQLLTRSQLATCHYNNACTLALLGRCDEAAKELAQATALNTRYREQALHERDLAGCRSAH